jgi:hypothetical protein
MFTESKKLKFPVQIFSSSDHFIDAVKYPTFSAAKSGSSPVMNTAEHITFANPAA